MKLIYIQDDFLDPKLCQPFLELYDKIDADVVPNEVKDEQTV